MPKERKETVPITWRVSPTIKAKLEEEFGSASTQRATEAIINAYYVENPELKTKIAELEKAISEGAAPSTGVSNSEFEAAKKRIAELESAVKEKEDYINALADQFTEIQKKLEEKEKTEALESLQNEEDETLIPVYVPNEIVRKFLEEVRDNLEQLYHREVTFYEIFVMSTLLYNVEKRCDWFYPPLKDSKIEEVTGKSIKEWKKFLSQKEK